MIVHINRQKPGSDSKDHNNNHAHTSHTSLTTRTPSNAISKPQDHYSTKVMVDESSKSDKHCVGLEHTINECFKQKRYLGNESLNVDFNTQLTGNDLLKPIANEKHAETPVCKPLLLTTIAPSSTLPKSQNHNFTKVMVDESSKLDKHCVRLEHATNEGFKQKRYLLNESVKTGNVLLKPISIANVKHAEIPVCKPLSKKSFFRKKLF